MVPPSSDQVSRVWPYSGYCAAALVFTYVTFTLFSGPSHALRLTITVFKAVLTPRVFPPLVWPLPRSLATTSGISFDFSSSPYLDVSVQAVPLIYLCIQCRLTGLLPAGFPHSGIHGYNACFRLPVAFRRSLRPSSAPGAKAVALRPF